MSHIAPSASRRSGLPKTLRPASAGLLLSLGQALLPDELHILGEVMGRSFVVRRTEYLFRAGAPLTSIYLLRSGCMLTSMLTEDGREQVTGFPMTGELLGLDAVDSSTYPGSAMALQDSLIIELPFEALLGKAARFPELQHKLLQLMSRQIVRDQGVMMLLGSMNVDEKLASFILMLAEANRVRGYSASQLQLRMRREDIGSYLGIQLETVSRTLTRFQSQGLIRVQNRQLDVLNAGGLLAIVSGSTSVDVH